jgi:RNA polymerase sigma-70 factor (ECF subfamily)
MSTDSELLVAAQAGDRTAAEALLTRHLPAVLRFTHRMCSNPADAEDVAQDTLLAAYRGLGGFRGEGTVTTWLYAVARRTCARKHRRKRDAPERVESLDDHGDAPEGESPGPDETAAGHELGAALELAIRELPVAWRSVLVLRDVEGLPANEVAEALGIEVGTVKTRLHRARAALRARLAPHLVPGAPEPLASCPEVVTRFSRYLEGEIGPAECERMHAHVDTCPSCNAACASLRRSVAVCRASASAPPPAVVQRVREALSIVVGGEARRPGAKNLRSR